MNLNFLKLISKIYTLLFAFVGGHNGCNSKIKFICTLYVSSLLILNRWWGRALGSSASGQGRLMGSCGHGNGFRVPYRGGNVLSSHVSTASQGGLCFQERYCGSCHKTPRTVRFNVLQCKSQLSYICSRVENFV